MHHFPILSKPVAMLERKSYVINPFSGLTWVEQVSFLFIDLHNQQHNKTWTCLFLQTTRGVEQEMT